ncbi:MAG: GGDEF domain-containing protein, partial [Candidatus Adiutrix sp.]
MTTCNNSTFLNLGFDILMTMDVAILRRLSPLKYEPCGMIPYFYAKLFPQQEDGGHCEAPWLYSPVLECFLEEVEIFFETNPEIGAFIATGIWVEHLESGEQMPLMATARVTQSAQVLLIRAVHGEFSEKEPLLPKGKNKLTQHSRINYALNSFKKRSLYDSLTRLYNRGAFLDILQNQIAALRTYSPNLALLMLNIDNFEQVNADLGHLSGDAVLAQLGEILRNSLRKNDAAVRYSGEEFMVIAPNTSLKQSVYVADKLRRILET